MSWRCPVVLLAGLWGCGARPAAAPAEPPSEVAAVYGEAINGQFMGYIKDGANAILVARDTVVPPCPGLTGTAHRLVTPAGSIFRVELVDGATVDLARINSTRLDAAGFVVFSDIHFNGPHAVLYSRHDDEPGRRVTLDKRFGRWWLGGSTPCAATAPAR